MISLWLPRLPTDRLRRRSRKNGKDPDQRPPLITVTETGGRFLVTALEHRAEMASLTPGMVLTDARAIFPAVDVALADPVADAALLDRLTAWCGRYTPWAAAEGRDGIFLDTTGCDHLFGGEAALCADLVHRLEALGFSARAAMADTPGAAWAMARFGENGTVVPFGGIREALARLPVAALRLDPGTVGGLARVGIRVIEQLRNMPRAPLTARFGRTVGERLDQASGAVSEPISPRKPVTPFHARLAFAEPIALMADIERGLRHLLDDLCRLLAKAGRGGRTLVLTLYRVDGETFEIQVGAARPARDPGRLARLFGGRLGSFDAGFGIEVMTLTASVTEPLAPTAVLLPAATRAPVNGGESFRGDILAPLVDRLGNRIGFDRVARLTAVASYVPERAVRPRPALADAMDFTWSPDASLPPRPLHLLKQPERIEIVSDTEPDTPPIRFRWRRTDHSVRLAEGPERIAPEWWVRKAAARTRDYWRVEDGAGRHFWIYRHGLPRPDHPVEWFLHGLFA